MPYEPINLGVQEGDRTGDFPRAAGFKINRMLKEIFDDFARKIHRHASADLTDATLAGRALLTAAGPEQQRLALNVRPLANLTDLDDVVLNTARQGQELRHNGLHWENRDRTVPQFVVSAGTLVLTRAAHFDASITLLAPEGGGLGLAGTVTLLGSDVGDGFRVKLRNRTGGTWQVPPFPGVTLEFEANPAHTAIVSNREATIETYSRGGTRYAAITGATV